MAAQSASNLIMTRARARYGQRFTKKNYSEMSALGSVVEVADYLSNTDYGAYIDKSSKALLHRKNLEQLLRKEYISEIERFCRYEASVGEHIFEYFLMDREIQSLLNFIHLLSIGKQREFIFTFSKSFESFVSLDLSALAQVETTDELKKFLIKTRYKKIADLLPNNNSTDYDFSMLETALDRMLYNHVLSIASSDFPDSAKKELNDIFHIKSEMLDLMMIYRAKRFFNESPHYIRSNLIGNRYLFTASEF
ncbi:MAG: V-type ATPase subunit, partial [bacterium]|nr:V-type ATPase subunit [bacterium]